MKRLLICLLLLATYLAPSRALAALILPAPWWVVFTFTADPLDPLGGTSTGWYYIGKTDDMPHHPITTEWDVDFWWQAHHWTEENTVGTVFIDLQSFSYGIYGGGETAPGFDWGNLLDLDFDIRIDGGVGDPAVGQTYDARMSYVNPTASHNAANGQSYVASGSWYVTDQQPPPASPPGIPEPSPLALMILGLGAMVASRRKP